MDTAAEYAEKKAFQGICQNAGVTPTRRQAAKFLRGMGRAYKLVKRIPLAAPRREHDHATR